MAIGLAVLLTIAALVALGTWQVHRRAWKHALVAQVDERIAAAPVPAPGRDAWPGLSADHDEYRRVTLSGTFLHGLEAPVQALTEMGGGFWIVTPLRTPEGPVVFVNRGFVPAERRDPATRAAGQVGGTASVTGLLRMSEPGGGWLRRNDPAANRWYSRDVAAMAAVRGLGDVAPYFVDADATPNPGGWPVGGLTVTAFSDNHLIYALTWYALAAMLAGAAAWAVWQGRAAARSSAAGRV